MAGYGPQRLGDVLQELIERLNVQQGIDHVRAIETWAALAGPQINTVTRNAWMDGKTLVVQISSAAWRQELHMKRGQWRDRLNGELGKDIVEEIRFR